MADDLELLAGLPDGTLTIDVLAGTANHSVNGSVRLHIAGDLKAWLERRLSESGIERSEVETASVTAGIRTDRIATNRKRIISFDFSVDSTIATAERVYRGRLCEVHRWHSRVPSNNRLQATRETRAPEA